MLWMSFNLCELGTVGQRVAPNVQCWVAAKVGADCLLLKSRLIAGCTVYRYNVGLLLGSCVLTYWICGLLWCIYVLLRFCSGSFEVQSTAWWNCWYQIFGDLRMDDVIITSCNLFTCYLCMCASMYAYVCFSVRKYANVMCMCFSSTVTSVSWIGWMSESIGGQNWSSIIVV